MAENINLVDYNSTTAFWTFMIYCLVVVFVAVFFLFFASRVFAQLLSKLIRWFTWRHMKAYIEFESLQIAPLGGRILFKNFRYHSRNQSITVLHGYITFRYWLWNVRTEDDPIPDDSAGAKNSGMGMVDEDNCRITCNLVGLEWFMYNRTPAYDILATTLGLNPDSMPLETPDATNPSVSLKMGNGEQDDSDDSWFRRCLPVKVSCETGAIIMGNAHLPSLLVASFPWAHGMYSATKARSALDKYKTVLLVTFETPSIDFRPNADYNTTIAGRHMGQDIPNISQLPPRRPTRIQKWIRPLKDTWTRHFGVSRRVAEEWHGLPRYNQNISHDNLKGNKFQEYAMVRNILQCSSLGLRYYTDVAGKVPERSQQPEADIDLPPEWSIELLIDEAVISYGPWADRQRAEIQNFYFPNSFRSVEVTPEPQPGEDRIHAALQMMVTFSSDFTIKIPTQEISKDWKYNDSEFQAVQGGKSMRPFGWLEMKADRGSLISVDIPMIYGTDGYKNVVLVELYNLVTTSSVNYAPVLTLKELKMVCQLQNPLIWNAQRNWDFEFTMDSANIFLLRDHITLIQDLSKDWTSGPSVDMAHFVPFKYEFDIKLPNFKLYTYVNEHNIINEPTEMDENAFIIASGTTLDLKVVLPFVQFNPEITSIEFDVEICNGKLEIQLPLAHTLGEFSTKDAKEFAVIPSVAIKGAYNYYDFVDPSHIESLNLDVKGHGVTVKLFGNVIRYVLILMDNYAGLYLNFVTMEEYRMKRSDAPGTEWTERKQVNAKPPSDPFEVYVHFLTTDTTLILPENLYSCDNYSEITCAELQLDLRNLDIYMDMDVNISPLTWSRHVAKKAGKTGAKPSRSDQNYLYIDGISVYAHRLFGPLPKTTTYVANWKLDIGSIYGQIKPSFLLGVTSFAKAFAYNLKDGDNAFPLEYATVTPPDITFVDLTVKEVDVSIWGKDVVSQILLKDGVIVHFDDVINERYLGRVVLKLQSLLVRSMALTEANKDSHTGEADPMHHDQAPWVEIASLNCAFDITVYTGSGDWRIRREKQQNFVREQDRETLRCPYIYARKGQAADQVIPHPNFKGNHFGTLYVPPLTSDPAAMKGKGSSIGSGGSSFIEVATDNGSVYEYASNASSPSESQRASIRRSASSFSIGCSSDGDSDSDASSEDSRRWRDIDSDDLDPRYSSDDGDSDVEFESPEILQVPTEPEIKNSPSFPVRSIPYSSYLKRYSVSASHSSFHRNPYMPPPRVLFSQSKTGEILEDIPRHHPHANFDDAFGVKTRYDGLGSSAQPKGQEVSDEKRTTLVIEATQDVKILLTPILLKIIQEFLEAINAEEWDLETMLDVTQMEYVELLTSMQPSKLHSQQFVINIPRIHLRFIQDVMMPDALNGGDDINMIKTRYELSGANLCAIDIVLDDAAILGAVKLEDEEFEKFDATRKIHIASFKVIESRANIDFTKFKLNARFVSTSTARLFGIPDARHQFSRLGINHLSYLNEPVIADITFEHFKLRLVRSSNPNYFSANLEKFAVMFINQSAEIVAGSICSWLTFLKDLKTILNRFQLRRSKQLQTLFSEIARFSAQKAINTDPVFLTRPSTTLRLGTLIYRNDDGWKLLGHIRHCMGLMPAPLRDTLQEALKKPELEAFSSDTMYDIVISVFSNWRSWEMDDLRKCRLFTDVFERKPLPNLSNATLKKESVLYEILRFSSNSIQLSLGELEAAIYDEQMENKMKVHGLEFIFESRYKQDALPQTGLFPGVPVSTESSRLTTGYLDIAVKTGFKTAEIDINPVIIAFTRHILRIERIFATQFNKILEPVVDKRQTEVRKAIESPSSPRQSLHLTREALNTAKPTEEPTILEVVDRFDIVFNGMAVVETIRITLTAHNLTAQVIVSQIQISALNFAKQRSYPNQDIESISVAKSSGSNPDGSAFVRSGFNKLIASVATNINSINSSLKERLYSKDSAAPAKELLTFGIIGINSEATLSQFTPVKRPKQTKASVPREVINLLVTFKQVNFALPRSILKLYLFAKDWREENMQSFDFLFQGVMNEWEADRKQQPKIVAPTVPRELKVQVVLKTLTLESQMLPSLLFQYEAGDLMFMLHDIPPGLPFSTPQLTYTAQLLRQSVDFIANQPKTKGAERSRLMEDKHAASFSLPVIRASGSVMNVIDSAAPARNRRSSITGLARGTRHPKKLESSVSFDFVEMTLNVNMLDHILTAQSLLGAELNELIDILGKGGNAATTSASPAVAPTSSPSALLYSVKVSLVGLSIAAVSPSAVLYFESDLLKGVITNNPNPAPVTPFPTDIVRSRLAWRLYAQSITLSLNHHIGNIRLGSRAEDIRARKLRLAYITINLNVQNFSPNTSDKDRFAESPVSSFYVSFLKVHALMQPQSVSRIIGMYSYYTHELERRKELKATDMTKLADNTKRIIKSLDVEVPAYKDNARSMLEATEIFLTIDDVAVAIPLDRREDIMDSSERLVEAFLISATSISVLTKSGETSSGTLSHLCAQFVPRFDQSKDEHFRSRSHPKMNRLSFPNISCQVEASKDSPGHQKIASKASVSGFELDIDPTIVRYINTLTDVYDNSKDLVISLNVEQAATASATHKFDGVSSTSTPKSELPTPQVSSNVIWKIENTFTCSNSVCRFYPKSYVAKLPKASKFSESESNFAHVGAEVSGVDRFVIPGLSLWTTLRIPLGDNLAELQAAGPPRIHAEVNIHSCENTFYPSLVPFFQDIVTGLKVGIRRQRQYSDPETIATPGAPSSHGKEGSMTLVSTSNSGLDGTLQQVTGKRQELAVTLYLFIEKTRIEFNCQPMAKVMSVLAFEQGNILMSYSSDHAGNNSSTIAGTFEGASSDTHHIFSQDKGLKLETKGMIFNAVAETKRQAEVNKKTLSVTVDFRQIGCDFDMRQAEILVLMKMIWMDQANYLIRDSLTVSRSTSSTHGFEPSISSQSVHEGRTPSIGAGGSLVPGKRESSFLGYNVFVVARLQQMRITGDLGSQIGKMDFKLDEVRLRTKLRPFHPRSASITTGPLDLQFLPMGRGWLEGYLVLEGVTVQTLSKVNRHQTFPCSIMEIVVQTNKITSMLTYDYKKFFILAVGPARVVLQDHWNGPNLERDVSQAIIAHLQGLRLLAGAKTVPVFKTLLSRMTSMLEQKLSAAKEELRKPLLTPASLQPDMPQLSRSASQASGASVVSLARGAAWFGVGFVQISFGNLDLSFFPYFLSDKECTHASIQGFKVRMDRDLIFNEGILRPIIHRLTTINLALLSLQKYTLQVVDQNAVNALTLEQWFERIRNPGSTTIAKLPTTSQLMESWQEMDSLVIEHNCKTAFAGLIDIATDYRLFRGVEKNFQRFLEELSIRNYKDLRSLEGSGVVPGAAGGVVSSDGPVDGVAVGSALDLVGGGAQPMSRLNSQDPSSLITATANPDSAAVPSVLIDGAGKDTGVGARSLPPKSDASSTGSPSSPIPTQSDSVGATMAADGSGSGSGSNSVFSPTSLAPTVSPLTIPALSIDPEAGLLTEPLTKVLSNTSATGSTANGITSTTNGEGSNSDEDSGPKFIFQAREQIVFKPALDILPNTPLPLGHLGFKKEDIPPIVHIVTTGLETGLLTVVEFHEKKVKMTGLHDLWEGKVIMDDEDQS